MAGRRSSSPYGYQKPASSFCTSSLSSASSVPSSFNVGSGGRIIPRSSPSSVSSHNYPSSVTPSRGHPARSNSPPVFDELITDAVDSPRSGGDSISVTVRFRPLSEREFQRGAEIAWYADGDRMVRCEYNVATAYAFDRAFGPSTTSHEVYDVAARPVVKAAMEGINGTVFAYGVTSSGKTHTMHGDLSAPGIIPLAIKDVFSIIQDTPGREFLLRVSYIEIYNEVINDLLDPTGQNLRVREDAQGTYVEGIKEEVVLSPGHALSFIAAGEEHRHVGSNNFNLFSSRSHTIFTLMIESSARGDEYDGVIFSQLNLIDLAGSESSKTETTGLRRKEGSYINKSLLTLGTVIGKLSEGKASHIPYRDSKLTRLLQSSLSGHGHVSLICTVTPASSSMEETHNTLKFASRAKRVEIYATRNRIIDEKSLIKKYQREISNLKCELEQLRKGIVVGVNQDEIISLRQKLEEGQVKMQSRLEEEEDAKAALLSRIQRLTKLILVSSKNTIPGCLSDLPSQHSHSLSEDEKLDSLHDGATLVNMKDSTSDSVGGLSDSKHQCSSSKLNEENSPGSSSVTESSQAGMVMSDQVDLLFEQVKMLAGEIAFSTSTLKRLMEQSVNDPEGSHIQIRNLEREIQDKRRQMKALEQRITETGEALISNASLVDMQQTVMRLMTHCNEKDFELEIKTADNRILQEQLQQKCLEVKDLRDKVLHLEQQLTQAISEKSTPPSENHSSNDITVLKAKLDFEVAENGKLNHDRVKLLEENSSLVSCNQKLSQEASYAKELASSAAVELKSLAEEVTKLSLENERLEKELLIAQEMSYSRCGSSGCKYPEGNIEGLKLQQRSLPRSRGSDVGSGIYDDVDYWNNEFDDMTLGMQQIKEREASLEAALAEKEHIEEEYKRKLEDARKRESTLENDLASMWVLVAKLRKGISGISELNANEKSNLGVDLANDLKENKHDCGDMVLKERQECGDTLKERQEHIDGLLKVRQVPIYHLINTANEQFNQSSQLEPVLARLKACIQEMKEKEIDITVNGDANSHICKVCFESPAATVLLPCRHFCLCKPCSFACLECPVCRGKIDGRIVTFT